MPNVKNKERYSKLSPSMALNLAAPHTWPAAVLPVLFSVIYVVFLGFEINYSCALVLLLICICMQACVNTLNDYHDFKKGADTLDNQHDPSDAVLVYNNVNPAHVKRLAYIFLALPFIIGFYVVYIAGPAPYILGLAGAFFVIAYSSGKTPVSYLPIGELVSGLAMGCLIPFACVLSLTGQYHFEVILLSVPFIISIALIMLTNNTCDIEKDAEVGRCTLPVLFGRKKSKTIYKIALIVWLSCIIAITVALFTPASPLLVVLMILAYPQFIQIWKNPLVLQTRIPAMGAILGLNITLGISYSMLCMASMVLS